MLLVSDKYIYNGKIIDVSGNVTEIVQALASKGLESVIVVGQLEKDRRPKCLPRFDSVKAFDWPSFLDLDKSSTGDIDFWRGPAMAPVYILYSSGGLPALWQGICLFKVLFFRCAGVRGFYFCHLLDVGLRCPVRQLESQSVSYIMVSPRIIH
jgi:hypothetical protein